jgi:hypothetical protein
MKPSLSNSGLIQKEKKIKRADQILPEVYSTTLNSDGQLFRQYQQTRTFTSHLKS